MGVSESVIICRSNTSSEWKFDRPKHMPEWLYHFFTSQIGPQIIKKNGKTLTKPPSFKDQQPYSTASMWINPPDPIMSLSQYKFDPQVLYRPRIFLWLPHFFVDAMYCPICRTKVLEKNGPCPPRRIIDIENAFWIITWSYYCRKGCRRYFRGWNPVILNSLPPYLRLAFPAVLSQKSGLSHRVITELRVGNQHKMGPSGVRSLLLEMHTRYFNTLQIQYLEAGYELLRGNQDGTQATLHHFMGKDFKSFGDFSDPDKYSGFVPTESYLANMMTQAIERDEADANQHTACIAPDQISIDDSHKVSVS